MSSNFEFTCSIQLRMHLYFLRSTQEILKYEQESLYYICKGPRSYLYNRTNISRLHCTASVTAPCLLVSSVLSMIIMIGLTITFLIGTAAKVQEVELIMKISLVKCK